MIRGEDTEKVCGVAGGRLSLSGSITCDYVLFFTVFCSNIFSIRKCKKKKKLLLKVCSIGIRSKNYYIHFPAGQSPMRRNCHCESQVTVALSVTSPHPWATEADGPLMPPVSICQTHPGTQSGTEPGTLGRVTGACWGFRTRPAARTNLLPGRPSTGTAVTTPRMKALRGTRPEIKGLPHCDCRPSFHPLGT